MDFNDQEKLERVKKQVKEIKGFYTHLSIYLAVNVMLMLSQMGLFNNGFFNVHVPAWSAFTTPFFWGIGLTFHAFRVFHHKFAFFKGWEERKTQEYMDKEEEEFKNTTRWD